MLISATVGRFYNIVGFILAFGSPLYHPVSKGGSVNIFSGNILTPLYFERFFVKLKYNKNIKIYNNNEKSNSVDLFIIQSMQKSTFSFYFILKI